MNDRDIEEILHSLGLDLSRLDVQRLMKKLSSRDRVNYRNLTDKWVDKDGDVKYAPSSTNDLESKMELLKGIFSNEIILFECLKVILITREVPMGKALVRFSKEAQRLISQTLELFFTGAPY